MTHLSLPLPSNRPLFLRRRRHTRCWLFPLGILFVTIVVPRSKVRFLLASQNFRSSSPKFSDKSCVAVDEVIGRVRGGSGASGGPRLSAFNFSSQSPFQLTPPRIEGLPSPQAAGEAGRQLGEHPDPRDPRYGNVHMPTSEQTETELQVAEDESYFWNQGYDVPEVTALEKDQFEWDFGCVHLYVCVPNSTLPRDVDVTCQSHAILVAVRDRTVLKGELWNQIRPDDIEWELTTKLDKPVVHILMPKATKGHWVYCLKSEEVSAPNWAVTNRVWMEFEADGCFVGRVVFGLYGNAKTKAVENFRALCTGEKGRGKAAPNLWYKGNNVHLILRNALLAAGDIVNGTGDGGESIYGASFQDRLDSSSSHCERGMLSLVSMPREDHEPEKFGSQFTVTLQTMQYLDRHQMIIGKVLSGMDVLEKVSQYGRNRTELRSADDLSPTKCVRICDCGEEQVAVNYIEEKSLDQMEMEQVQWEREQKDTKQ